MTVQSAQADAGPRLLPQPDRLPDRLLALCTSVALERAAYYGLQSILALYLAEVLAAGRPGIWLLPAAAQLAGVEGLALAGVITGAFVSVAALSPALGAVLADRVIGHHRAIVAGGMMMSAGHGLLMVEAALLPALALIALGAGLFKGPAAARLSGLYVADDPRRVDGFRLFYIAINIGGLIAPLVIGTLGERVNWHAGFAVSCAAMVAGLGIYLARFGPSGEPDLPAKLTPLAPALGVGSNLAGLVLLGASVALLSVPNAQLTNAYLLWAKQGFVRELWGWEFPASWIIAADGLLGLFALAGSGLAWRWFERRAGAVAAATKAMLGAASVVAAAGMLVLASLLHGRSGVPLAWGLSFQFLNSLGLANVLPAAMAMFGQSSTRDNAAMAMAGFYLSVFAGGVVSTVLASQFPSMPITLFWLIHALCAIGGGLGLVLLRHSRQRRSLAPLVAG